jgi:DNA-binding NtrC family response regulator
MAYILIVDSQAEFCQQLVLQLDKAGHRAAAVATVSAATKLSRARPDLPATDGVPSDGSSASLVQQAEAAGAKVLMIPKILTESSSPMEPVNPTSQSQLPRKRSYNGFGRCLARLKDKHGGLALVS